MFISVATDNVFVAPPWERAVPADFGHLDEIPAATVGDVLGRMTVIDGAVRLVTRRSSLVGTALTVDARSGDNLAIHRALDEAQPGDVLVVNGHGDTSRAVIGDLIGEIMISAGMVGAVVDGAVRDVAALSEMGLTVYARAVTPAGPFKDGPGSVGVPVAVGGVVIEPGDVLVGDADGVVTVPRERAKEVGDAVDDVVAKEQALRQRILAARADRTERA